jgi:large subunit ribosomal protein L4
MATTTTKPAVTSTALPKTVFDVAIPNHELLKLAYEAYLANGRENYAKTLKRGEVRGGGKKPWKQKGTGRARFGSSRNPIWRKGGVVFGPSGNENYSKNLPIKAKRVAIRQALTLANQAGQIAVISDVKATGKTADMVKWLADQKVDVKNIVIVVDTKTPELVRATNNLQNVQVVQANYLNVFTILNADKLMMTNAAVKAVEGWLGA